MATDRHQFIRLRDAIRSADRILLMTHKRPDGDAAGSATALLGWLVREGKDVTAFCRDPLPDQLRFLDHGHRITQDVSVFDAAYDLVVTLDSGDLRHCGVHDLLPRVPKGYVHLVIDHHPTNPRYGDLNSVDPDASSTCEILHRFFDANGIRVDHAMATSMLTGVLTDTDHFSNAATTSSSIAAASALISAGARLSDIVRNLQNSRSIESLKLWGLMLSRLTYNPTYELVTTYLLETDVPRGSPDAGDMTSGFGNFLNAVAKQADTVMILQELPTGEVKGSLRSVSRDVSAIAKKLGGGGHVKASGFTVKGRIQETPDGPKIVPDRASRTL